MVSRFLLGVVFACIMVMTLSTSPVFALTQQELQTQIQTLLSQISSLTQQINILKSQPQTPVIAFNPAEKHRICAIARNLSQGATGQDVTSLQDFLKSEGYFSGTATGYFGPVTVEAVKKWQVSQGVEGVGSVGPMSREKIKIWCGGTSKFNVTPKSGQGPLTVTFKALVGGFTPYRYAIDFGDGSMPQEVQCSAPADVCISPATATHTYTSDGTYTAVLWQFNANSSINDPSRVALAREYIRVGPVACTKEYKPVCASKQVVCITTPCNPVEQTYSNRCMAEADGAKFIYEGQCRSEVNPSADRRCKSWYDGCNTCSRETADSPAMCTLRACTPESMGPKYCTAYFDTGSNKSPVISSFSGPTTIKVGQSGTWTIKASDPENHVLTYRILWGDDVSAIDPYKSAAELGSTVQTTTFTHTYNAPGTYTVLITVIDSAGNEAKASATVKVESADVACTMQYDPVCGRPPGCANTCPAGMYCTMQCQLHTPQTYGNRCQLDAAGATFLHTGQCTSTSGNWY